MRFLLASFLLLSPFTHAANLSKADVERIVADYIAKNGDKVMAGLEAYQERKQHEATKNLITPNTPVLGPATAPVTIIEFSDFECPFCHRVQENIMPLRAKYENKIRWAYKHFPLEFHAKAPGAAMAAYAANKQGKFWEFSKIMWPNQDKLGDSFYLETAKKLGLNEAKFNADRTSADAKKMVDADTKDGLNVGVRGTPFFLINGTPVSGAQPTEAFVEIIDAALAKAGGK